MKRAGLDAFEVGGELALTQEETTETIVPDYCPDIARIIETEGKVFLHSRELQSHVPLSAGSKCSCLVTGISQ